uniref:CST complex subunit STN1 isoform X4 n=1 Tax=Pristiophorus japonicus TaxID=55135 RepID=UPI00398E580B
MPSDGDGAEDTVPSMLWGLDPLHGVFAKLYIKDILQLDNSQHVPGVFFYKTHPISKVDILGTIVQKREREKLFSFGVDDGTGVISCVLWKKRRPMEGPKPVASPTIGLNLQEQLSRITMLEQHTSQLELGDTVQVRGWLRDYRDQREISCTSLSKVADPVFTAQISRMLQLPHLYRTFYDQTFQLTTDSTEPNDQRVRILSLQRKIKQFLNQNGVKNFYQQELETINSLAFIAQQDPVSPCVQHPPQPSQVTDEDKELRSLTLGVIRDDSRRPKYVDKGCPFLHILSCVQHGYSAGVNEATMQRVLDRLESDSQIVSTMERYYMAS